MTLLPVGPYRPDLAASNAGVSAYVMNVVIKGDETGIAYGPHPSLSVTSGAGALPARPQGGIKAVLQAGTKKMFVGTAATVEEMANDFTWTARTTGKACPSTDNWSFAQYGNKLLMTNTADGLLDYDLETPAGVAAVSGAPKFRYIFNLFETVAGLYSDGDSRLMRYSAPGGYTNWTTAGAGYQPFADGEELMAGGELSQGYAIMLQRKAVHLLTRTGDRRIFARNKMADGVGSANPWNAVFANGAAYFIDTNGVYRASPESVVNIGEDKVSRTFIDSLVGDLATIQGVYDPKYRRIVWRYQEKANNSTTIFEKMLTLDLRSGEFAIVATQTSGLFQAALPGYTADNASALGTVDTAPYGPDSRFWLGGDEGLLGVNSDFKAGFFGGTNLAATLDTSTLMSETDDVVTRVTPVSDAANITVAIGTRKSLSDTVAWGTAQSKNASGWCQARSRGKCKSARLSIAAGESWTFVRGIDFPNAVPGGRR